MNVLKTITRPFDRVKETYDEIGFIKKRIGNMPETRQKAIIAVNESRL